MKLNFQLRTTVAYNTIRLYSHDRILSRKLWIHLRALLNFSVIRPPFIRFCTLCECVHTQTCSCTVVLWSDRGSQCVCMTLPFQWSSLVHLVTKRLTHKKKCSGWSEPPWPIKTTREKATQQPCQVPPPKLTHVDHVKGVKKKKKKGDGIFDRLPNKVYCNQQLSINRKCILHNSFAEISSCALMSFPFSCFPLLLLEIKSISGAHNQDRGNTISHRAVPFSIAL